MCQLQNSSRVAARKSIARNERNLTLKLAGIATLLMSHYIISDYKLSMNLKELVSVLRIAD